MFDNPFPFTKHFTNKIKGGKHLCERTTYTFNTTQEKYFIEVEKYNLNIYIIKFFPTRLKKHPRRFNILTGENKMGHIVATCIQLILQILKRDPMANFGFLGSQTFDPKRNYEESKVCTKRFIIYRYAVYSLIGEEYFSHFMEEKNSTYLLVNNKHENPESIKDSANIMFDEIYPSLN